MSYSHQYSVAVLDPDTHMAQMEQYPIALAPLPGMFEEEGREE